MTFEHQENWPSVFKCTTAFISQLLPPIFDDVKPLLEDLRKIRESDDEAPFNKNLDKVFAKALQAFGPQVLCRFISLRLPNVEQAKSMSEQQLMTVPRHWLIHLLRGHSEKASMRNYYITYTRLLLRIQCFFFFSKFSPPCNEKGYKTL